MYNHINLCEWYNIYIFIFIASGTNNVEIIQHHSHITRPSLYASSSSRYPSKITLTATYAQQNLLIYNTACVCVQILLTVWKTSSTQSSIAWMIVHNPYHLWYVLWIFSWSYLCKGGLALREWCCIIPASQLPFLLTIRVGWDNTIVIYIYFFFFYKNLPYMIEYTPGRLFPTWNLHDRAPSLLMT